MIILIGAAWGVFEAVAGQFLHIFAPGFGAYIWYPAAFFFLGLAYFKTQNYKDVLTVAFIAALFKLLNLINTPTIDIVIKPALSILSEAVIFVLIHKLVSLFITLISRQVRIASSCNTAAYFD